MDRATAERWVTISALLVAGIYAYRRLIEPTSTPVTGKQLLGSGSPPPLGAFATAWGFTYLVVSIMATAAPGVGGAFAILIATGDLLTNSASLFADVGKQTGGQASSASAASTAAAAMPASAPSSIHPFTVGPITAPALPGATALLDQLSQTPHGQAPATSISAAAGQVGFGASTITPFSP